MTVAQINPRRQSSHLISAKRFIPPTDALTPSEREALAFLVPLSGDYPEIEKWFVTKVVPGLRVGTRTILRVERDHKLVGLGIAKSEDNEKKICTVRVDPTYVGRGTGVRIFDGLLKWLDVDHPHLSVSDGKLPLFERIFDYYGFSHTSIVRGLYVPHQSEHGYNEAAPGIITSGRDDVEGIKWLVGPDYAQGKA